MNRFSIQFLVRPGCHLCADAAPAVFRAARASGSVVEVIDIESDDELVRDYGIRIPVVRVDGEAIAEGVVSAGVLWWRILRRRFTR